MMYIRPFGQKGNTVNAAVTGTSAALAITRPSIGTQSVRIVNSGTQVIFVEFGVSTVAAVAATSMPILANTVETFVLANEVTHIAAIASTTGSTMYVTTGESA